MNDIEFRAFLNLMMCSDPWPTGDESEDNVLVGLANKEAKTRGYDTWIEAYHIFGYISSPTAIADSTH